MTGNGNGRANGARRAEGLGGLLDAQVLGGVEVELEARLGRGRITLGDLAAMERGAILALDTPLNGEVDLIFNAATVARGEIVAVGDQLGLRVTEVFARKD